MKDIFGQILGGLSKADQLINPKRRDVKPAPPARKPFPWPAESAAPVAEQPKQQQKKPAAAPEPSKEERVIRGFLDLVKKR